MDEETRQPRNSEDYMAQIIARLNANSAGEAWLMVDKMAGRTVLVSVEDGKLAFARGIRVGAWQQVLEQIATMINEAVV